MAHVVLRAQPGAALKLLVEPAERRALVAGDERARVEAAVAVGAVLVEHEPHEALYAGQEDPAVLEHVLVVEADLAEGVLPLSARGAAAASFGALLPTPVRAVAKRGRIHSSLP